MNKEFIPYPEALALKELGFNELTLATYHIKSKEIESIGLCREDNIRDVEMLAPLWQQAFDFFREKYNQPNSIIDNNGHGFYILLKNRNLKKIYSTYPEAKLACLKKLIEIVKYNK